ncbi:GNAT family N-acetyltransferase [Aquicoccus sp. SCR17]|nr:GNAT family N-acetyltransferase [Carideicomes alvinocaridis]
MPQAAQLYEVVAQTWPAAACEDRGPWCLREGQGGGKRVSAATARAPVSEADLPEAEAWMRAHGQPCLFQIRQGEEALDDLLAARGYGVVDPVNMYVAPAATLASLPQPPKVHTYTIWEPLQIQYVAWARGGIGPGRWAVMDRVAGPRTSILARYGIQKGATAFAAIHEGIAMVHAVEVEPDQRRKGIGRGVMQEAARWALTQDAPQIAVVCTKDNAGANGLYASLGMTLVGQYHYRMKEE